MKKSLIKVISQTTTYKVVGNKIEEPTQVHSSEDAVKILRPFFGPEMEIRESFHVLGLSRKNMVKCHFLVSIGGITSTIVDKRLIFKFLLENLCTAFIVSHNHPSGNDTPSESDNQLTKKLKEAGKLLDINLLDHVILTAENHYSYANNGTL